MLTRLATVTMAFDEVPTDILKQLVALGKMTQHGMDYHTTVWSWRTVDVVGVPKVGHLLTPLFYP